MKSRRSASLTGGGPQQKLRAFQLSKKKARSSSNTSGCEQEGPAIAVSLGFIKQASFESRQSCQHGIHAITEQA